jgi:hydroxymethylbilane synthase
MSALPGRAVVLASRRSALARRQTLEVEAALKRAWPGIRTRTVLISTEGDRQAGRPLPEIGGKGLFTRDLEQALLQRRVDLAVHSLKDLPIEDSEGLMVAAILARLDPREALVAARGRRLEQLPQGAVAGTSSLRRQAQILALRPDLEIRPIRGNVETRVRKVFDGEFDATVLAAAGLIRLGLEGRVSECFESEAMLPAPGQGALAVQCRREDAGTRALLAPLDDPATRAEVTAERSFLHSLGGGCSSPVAALAHWDGSLIHLQGIAASPDGHAAIRLSAAGTDPIRLGRQLAAQARERGAHQVLAHA